jgi:hypothetical protein
MCAPLISCHFALPENSSRCELSVFNGSYIYVCNTQVRSHLAKIHRFLLNDTENVLVSVY